MRYYILAIDSLVSDFQMSDLFGNITFSYSANNNPVICSTLAKDDKVLLYYKKNNLVCSGVIVVSTTPSAVIFHKEFDLSYGVSIESNVKNTIDAQYIVEITPEQYNALKNRLMENNIDVSQPKNDCNIIQDPSNEDKPYQEKDFLSEIFMDEDKYHTLVDLLYYKKNIILQGAPGVGKTYLAKRLAYSIIGKKASNQVEMVQFHQNYSYEDFVMGYKPTKDGFALTNGVFYDFCKKAEIDNNNSYFFIIDEINRGNVSKILGELMMLLEGDKRGKDSQIKLAYSDEKFYVPENLYIIGMMNTADRSLAMMDYALRRRFSFFEVEPAFSNVKFRQHLISNIGEEWADKIIDKFKHLNSMISDEDKSGLGKGYCIGHSYFCQKPNNGQSIESWYKAIVQYEIAPLLDEYWWDDKKTANECKEELQIWQV